MENQNIKPVSRLPGIKFLFKRSWQIYQERIRVLLPFIVGSWFVNLINNFFLDDLSKSPSLNIKIIAVFLSLGFSIIYFLISLSLIFAIAGWREQIGAEESFNKARENFFFYLWMALLLGLITAAGLILFIIPGIIFSVWFSLAAFVFAVEGKRGFKALHRSKQLVSGYWRPVFGRFLALSVLIFGVFFLTTLILIPLAILGGKTVTTLLSSLIFVLLTPFIFAYDFLIYEELKERKKEITEEPLTREIRLKYILLAIFGALAPIILFIVFIVLIFSHFLPLFQ